MCMSGTECKSGHWYTSDMASTMHTAYMSDTVYPASCLECRSDTVSKKHMVYTLAADPVYMACKLDKVLMSG